MKKIVSISAFLLLAIVVVASDAFASASTVTAISVGTQTTSKTYGTAGSSTYLISLTESGNGNPASTSNFTINWTAPTGATAAFSSTNPVTLTGPGQTLTLTITTTSATPAGTTSFTVSSSNTAVTSASTNFVVGPKALGITANSASKVHNATLTFAGTEFSASGLINSNSVTGVTLTSSGATAGAAVGTYAIVPSGAVGSGLANYTITYNNGTLTVNPFGAAAKLAFTTPPLGVSANQPLSTQPVVTVQDQFGNTVTSSSAQVNLALTTTPPTGTHSLSGTMSIPAVNGVAAFTDIQINSTDINGDFQFTASSAPLTSAVSDPFGLSALPVELTSFTASLTKNGIVLRWNTATETNNAGFEIQRRTASAAWTKLGFVGGSGSSNVQHAYTYNDAAGAAGTYAYRLKQIDRNGGFEYSKEVEAIVGMTAQDFSVSQNYPNPFNPTTNIRFAVSTPQHATLKVYNVIGQEVATLFNGVAEAGVMQNVQFDATGFASGTYIYQLRTADRTEVKRMQLVR